MADREPNTFDMPGEQMICAVCGRPLDTYRDYDTQEVSYAHTRPLERDDHVAVPVPVGQVPVVARCDFCDASDPSYVVVANSFVLPELGHVAGVGTVDQHSHGNWAACAACAKLVERGAWGQLVTRVKQTAPAELRSTPRRVYLAMYEALAPNVIEVITHQEWEQRGSPR